MACGREQAGHPACWRGAARSRADHQRLRRCARRGHGTAPRPVTARNRRPASQVAPRGAGHRCGRRAHRPRRGPHRSRAPGTTRYRRLVDESHARPRPRSPVAAQPTPQHTPSFDESRMRPQQSAGPDQVEDVLVGLPRWGTARGSAGRTPTMPGRSRAVQVAGSQARPRVGFRVSAILRAVCAAVVHVAPRAFRGHRDPGA